jgi:hypothetical protein
MRILLLGVFATCAMALFVKPIRDALEGRALFGGGALLSLVGYALYNTVKDLEASLPPRPPGHR